MIVIVPVVFISIWAILVTLRLKHLELEIKKQKLINVKNIEITNAVNEQGIKLIHLALRYARPIARSAMIEQEEFRKMNKLRVIIKEAKREYEQSREQVRAEKVELVEATPNEPKRAHRGTNTAYNGKH